MACIADKKNLDKFACPLCNKVLSSKERVESHIKCVHMKAKHHVCEKCGSAYALVRDLEKHIKFVHERVRDQICDLCGYRTYNTQELGVHKKRVHEKREKVKRFECPHCDYKAFLKKTRDNHVKIMHIRLKDVQCPLCEYANYTKLSVNKHLIDTHLNFLGTHKCLECDHVAENKHQLKRHVRWEHHGGKREECPKCSFVATKTQKLWPHWRTHHPNEEVLHCDMCGYVTPLEYLMERHKTNIHSKSKIACPICGFETNAVNQLTKHIWLAHDKWNPHKCVYCNFKCGTEAQLQTHIDAEHDEKAMAEQYEKAEAALRKFQRQHWRYRRGTYTRKTSAIVAEAAFDALTTRRRRRPHIKPDSLNQEEAVNMSDERFEDLRKENRRLDATIARNFRTVIKWRRSVTYSPLPKCPTKQDLLRQNSDVNLLLRNFSSTRPSIDNLDYESYRLDRSIMFIVKENLKQKRSIKEDQIEVGEDVISSNNDVLEPIQSLDEQTRNAPVSQPILDKKGDIFGIKHICKIENVRSNETQSYDSVKIVDIYTSHVADKDHVPDCNQDRESQSHSVNTISSKGKPINPFGGSLHDYPSRKGNEFRYLKSGNMSLPQIRAALSCLVAFIGDKDVTQEISGLKAKFCTLVERNLSDRLRDENNLLDTAVATAIQRSRLRYA